MKDIKLKDGDIELDYVTGTDEIVQSGTLILSTRRGESDLVPELGMDRSSLLGKNFSKELAVSDVYEALEQDERFTNVTPFLIPLRTFPSGMVFSSSCSPLSQITMSTITIHD